MRRFFLVLLVLVLACRSPSLAGPALKVGQPVVAALELRGDLDFTPTERRSVERAGRILAAATSGAVRVTVRWDLDTDAIDGNETHILGRIESWYTWVQAIDPNGTLLGVTEPKRALVFLVTDRIAELDADLTSVALHEFLHAFRLPHLDVPGALMRPAYHGQVCLSKVDLAALCEMVGCDLARTNPCETFAAR